MAIIIMVYSMLALSGPGCTICSVAHSESIWGQATDRLIMSSSWFYLMSCATSAKFPIFSYPVSSCVKWRLKYLPFLQVLIKLSWSLTLDQGCPVGRQRNSCFLNNFGENFSLPTFWWAVFLSQFVYEEAEKDFVNYY